MKLSPHHRKNYQYNNHQHHHQDSGAASAIMNLTTLLAMYLTVAWHVVASSDVTGSPQAAASDVTSDAEVVWENMRDEAVAFWRENRCEFPQKEFYPRFDVCSRVYIPGNQVMSLCRALFNITRALCHPQSANSDLLDTLLHIEDLVGQENTTQVCSALERLDSMGVIPQGEAWFVPLRAVLTHRAICSKFCAFGQARPLCVSLHLAYNFIAQEGWPAEYGLNHAAVRVTEQSLLNPSDPNFVEELIDMVIDEVEVAQEELGTSSALSSTSSQSSPPRPSSSSSYVSVQDSTVVNADVKELAKIVGEPPKQSLRGTHSETSNQIPNVGMLAAVCCSALCLGLLVLWILSSRRQVQSVANRLGLVRIPRFKSGLGEYTQLNKGQAD
ncbi:uncharacterized protein LOC133338984 isoform X2 [Lethenteron reissneri]|uniref:uncharacterized protein LOC133338984 isoform X2 n=1 Tax=Lethenteron reissneri TaxID=7753 RepID=UPI002AB77125|nr:uncharacterized protein LOC133338984 isoform X2 [Lethenteron reissneri]